jgi:large subunit ribosomal protein L10
VSGVAKALTNFNKESKKVSVKAGSLDEKVLSPEEVKTLSNLPSIEVLQSKLLSLFNTPATQLVSVLSATPRSLVTVLKAKADKS